MNVEETQIPYQDHGNRGDTYRGESGSSRPLRTIKRKKNNHFAKKNKPTILQNSSPLTPVASSLSMSNTQLNKNKSANEVFVYLRPLSSDSVLGNEEVSRLCLLLLWWWWWWSPFLSSFKDPLPLFLLPLPSLLPP